MWINNNAVYHCRSIIVAFIDIITSPLLMMIAPSKGQTALMFASSSLEIVMVLVTAGADVNAKSYVGGEKSHEGKGAIGILVRLFSSFMIK